MEDNKLKITQKGWFKNSILVGIPTIISVLGVIIALIPSLIEYKNAFIFTTIVLMIILIVFIIVFSRQDEKIYEEYKKLQESNDSLTAVLSYVENNMITYKFMISTLSEMTEKWSQNINLFANKIMKKEKVSNKSWDKIKYFDLVCLQCKNMIKQYCNKNDDSKVSVSFVSYKEADNGEKFIHMVAHSSPKSIRPSACKSEEKLFESAYHYAELIKDGFSGIEVAINNNEVLRIFNKISKNTDLSQYTQYIAIPVYCTSSKLLGIFQVVTKYDYIIEENRIELLKFAEESILPYSNLIILIDKINKGLYISPGEIEMEE